MRDDVEAVAEGYGIVAERRVMLQVAEFGSHDIDAEAERLEFVGDEMLRFLLVSGQAGRLHQFLQKQDQFVS